MKKLVVSIAVVVAITAIAFTVAADEKRASPHETTTAKLGGKNITITYGRPYVKGRTIFGALVPWNVVWRTGADEATTIALESDVVIGGTKVAKGTYGLFTLPTEKQWTLVLNKVANQWGAFAYDEKLDVARIPMNASAAATPVEEFTIELVPNKTNAKQLTLKLAWDKAVATVPVSL